MAIPTIQNLAGMMAQGAPMGGGMENEAGEMVPCPVCMGTGMVPEDVAEGLGGGMPSSLAMRQPPQLSPMPMGAAPMGAPMSMGA